MRAVRRTGPWKLVFALALAIAAVVLAALGVAEVPHGHGAIHPQFASMESGGPGASRHAEVLWVGWLLGALEIGLFVALLAFGGGRRTTRGFGVPLLLGGIAYLAVWTALVLAYRAEASGAEPLFFLGFPAATAWMLFGLWPVPLLFAVYYVVGFDRWVATPDDLAELERRLASVREQAGNGSEQRTR